MATFRKGVRAVQMVGRASTYPPCVDCVPNAILLYYSRKYEDFFYKFIERGVIVKIEKRAIISDLAAWPLTRNNISGDSYHDKIIILINT